MELKKLRDSIDRIDLSIIKLLNKRANEALKVSEIKKTKKLTGYSPEREASMLRHLKKMNKT